MKNMFLARYNPWGKTKREQLQLWNNLFFDPQKTNIDEQIDLVLILDNMLQQDEHAKIEQFIETMPGTAPAPCAISRAIASGSHHWMIAFFVTSSQLGSIIKCVCMKVYSFCCYFYSSHYGSNCLHLHTVLLAQGEGEVVETAVVVLIYLYLSSLFYLLCF